MTRRKTTPQTPQAGTAERDTQVVSIDVPLTAPHSGYASNRIDAHLNGEQRETLKRLRAALDAGAVRLKSGRVVHTPADAVRWLLEQIAEQA